ncbi:DUF805 domain-containing protein [Staphylococcus equorum]|uniref:DUF805 domain-containing protein n=1 Tax=Staphylococcus equorum TaxID=246432 RepID=UPI000D1C4DCD|nr:DUF805 domain-containing protein [Staphylococcus equorum]PTE41794.1 DUF805 domain-containing protein [Staphylococcus equorum]PTE84587.1 DUF805 domain-containing protein [Staphylococcus equorum]PTF12541.1 DUF805 domain-containing protein [Staphylococcus equorum]RIL49247.1 DUF805 domain-containing protein [Staphylococcus equorum]
MERKIGFLQALKLFWTNYVNFKGRSRRSEYWYMTLWHLIFMIPALIILIIGLIMLVSGVSSYSGEVTIVGGILIVISCIYFVIYGLATLIPGWALLVRRFHDTGRKMVIPVIYFAVLIVTNIIITSINAMDPEYANISSIITLLLIYIIYMVLGIYCLVICCLDSERRTNKYGTSHKYGNHIRSSAHGYEDTFNTKENGRLGQTQNQKQDELKY